MVHATRNASPSRITPKASARLTRPSRSDFTSVPTSAMPASNRSSTSYSWKARRFDAIVFSPTGLTAASYFRRAAASSAERDGAARDLVDGAVLGGLGVDLEPRLAGGAVRCGEVEHVGAAAAAAARGLQRRGDERLATLHEARLKGALEHVGGAREVHVLAIDLHRLDLDPGRAVLALVDDPLVEQAGVGAVVRGRERLLQAVDHEPHPGHGLERAQRAHDLAELQLVGGALVGGARHHRLDVVADVDGGDAVAQRDRVQLRALDDLGAVPL